MVTLDGSGRSTGKVIGETRASGRIHDGSLAWTVRFGVTDRSSKGRIAPDTIFSVQSTSKN
jgi:hypothetical protein